MSGPLEYHGEFGVSHRKSDNMRVLLEEHGAVVVPHYVYLVVLV